MTEEAFLRYRMAVVERMPESAYKTALIVAIQSRMEMLRVECRTKEMQGRQRGEQFLPPGA